MFIYNHAAPRHSPNEFALCSRLAVYFNYNNTVNSRGSQFDRQIYALIKNREQRYPKMPYGHQIKFENKKLKTYLCMIGSCACAGRPFLQKHGTLPQVKTNQINNLWLKK